MAYKSICSSLAYPVISPSGVFGSMNPAKGTVPGSSTLFSLTAKPFTDNRRLCGDTSHLPQALSSLTNTDMYHPVNATASSSDSAGRSIPNKPSFPSDHLSIFAESHPISPFGTHGHCSACTYSSCDLSCDPHLFTNLASPLDVDTPSSDSSILTPPSGYSEWETTPTPWPDRWYRMDTDVPMDDCDEVTEKLSRAGRLSLSCDDDLAATLLLKDQCALNRTDAPMHYLSRPPETHHMESSPRPREATYLDLWAQWDSHSPETQRPTPYNPYRDENIPINPASAHCSASPITSLSPSAFVPSPPSTFHFISPPSLTPSTSASTSCSARATDVPLRPLPLYHPQPVRPIPPIPLTDIMSNNTTDSVRRQCGDNYGEENGSFRSHKARALSPLWLLCQPVSDAVRYQL